MAPFTAKGKNDSTRQSSVENRVLSADSLSAINFDVRDEFDSYMNSFLGVLVDCTHRCRRLPGSDYAFTVATYPQLKKRLDKAGERIRGYINTILQYQQPANFPFINDIDDAQDKFGKVVDLFDNSLEKVDESLDELRGIVPANKQSFPTVVTTTTIKTGKLDYRLIHAQNISRPQLKFHDAVDNLNTIFSPKLPIKPNAQMTPSQQNDATFVPAPPLTGYGVQLASFMATLRPPCNPYYREITEFIVPPWLLLSCKEQLYSPINSASFNWISTEEQLLALCNTLSKETAIAIDLEHHNYRSYQGFVCLMQISTRTEDFLIDTLVLRHAMHLLNALFTDPTIVKVLHGSDSDIIWLQRDFGLYIVNLFDTGQAARVLLYPSCSLAYLLHFYCNVIADKRYQLADWRIRPLPEEMSHYAREDTHYLLYIFDRLRNELINKSLLNDVLQRSKEISSRIYEKEITTDTSYLSLIKKYNLYQQYNNEQMSVFKGLFEWRDKIAREEDESVRYVLPNNMLFKLTESLPSDTNQLIKCCQPVPPLLRLNATDILSIILESRQNPIELPMSIDNLIIPSIPMSIDNNLNGDLNGDLTKQTMAVVEHKIIQGDIFTNVEINHKIIQPTKLVERPAFTDISTPLLKRVKMAEIARPSATHGFFSRVLVALRQEDAKNKGEMIADKIYESLKETPFIDDKQIKMISIQESKSKPTFQDKTMSLVADKRVSTAETTEAAGTASTAAASTTIAATAVTAPTITTALNLNEDIIGFGSGKTEKDELSFGKFELTENVDRKRAFEEKLAKRFKKQKVKKQPLIVLKEQPKTKKPSFDPTKSIEVTSTVAAKTEKRLPTQPKSGDRSMTFPLSSKKNS